MRLSAMVTAICLSTAALAAADEVQAAIRKQTNIPAQGLGPALQMLATERNFQLVYITERIKDLRTPGAVGELTATEALQQLLIGTGLTFRYLDDKTVTIEPGSEASLAPHSRTSSKSPKRQRQSGGTEIKRGFWSRLRLAQANAASTPPRASQVEGGGELISEILVTASRRLEAIQDIPYNISAITGEEMAAQGIDDLYNLSRALPGLTVNDPSPRAGLVSSVIIRGLNNSGIGLNNVPLTQQPLVATYLNDTPIFANLRYTDVERVEVLRGPQGTLYGAGSFGGALRFITRKPNLDELSTVVSAGTGTTAGSEGLNYEADAILNAPLGETWAIRLNVGREYSAGYIDAIGLYQLDANGAPALANPADPINSPALFRPTQKDVNDTSTDSARVALRWLPNDWLDATLTYQYQKQTAGGRDVVAYVLGGEDSRVAANLLEEPFESKVNLASLEAVADLGFATLTSASSYYETRASGTTDYLPLYLDLGIYESIYGASPRPLHRQHGANNSDALVQELRLVSVSGGRFDWVAGVYYLEQDVDLLNEQFYPGYQQYFDACAPVHGVWFSTGETVCGLGTVVGDRNGIHVTDESSYLSNLYTRFRDRAVFGELTWHVTDALQVTGGLRAFRQDYTTTQQAGLLWTQDLPANRTGSGRAEDIKFKFNTSYDFAADMMAYLTVSEGYRRGGVNGLPVTTSGVPTNPELFEFKPDTVLNKEIGIKGTIGGRFQFGLAYFDMDWRDMQVDAVATALVLQSVDNVGRARSRGAELELSGGLTRNLFVSSGLTFVDSKVVSVNAPEGLIGVPTAGQVQPGIPKLSANVHIRYTQQLLAKELTYGLTGAYRSSTDSRTIAGFDGDRDGEAYATWDVSALLRINSGWTVRAYVNNVFDKQAHLNYIREDFVQTNAAPLFGIAPSAASPRLAAFNDRAWSAVTPPRIFGIVITYSFGM
jgi:iron complex outermembrane recepter protein